MNHRPQSEVWSGFSNSSRMLLKNILAARCNHCASSTGLVMRRFSGSPPNMTQLNLLSHLTGELCFSCSASPSGKLEGRSLSALDFLRNVGAGRIELCKHADTKQCVFPRTRSRLLTCCRLRRTRISPESKMPLTSGFALYTTLPYYIYYESLAQRLPPA